MSGVHAGRERSGVGDVTVKSMGEMGKDFFTNFFQPYLENIYGTSCNAGSRGLIPELIPPPSLERFALSFGGGSHLGVPFGFSSEAPERWEN